MAAAASEFEGKTIVCKAAVAWAAKEPLVLEDVEVAPPADNEVRIKILHTAVCHTDAYTLDGLDPEGVFPCILGHEGSGIVESIGKDVTTVKVGDHVIPLYTAECQKCKFCLSGKTNLCQAIRSTQGAGVMPDGTSRFKCKGKTVYHFMGTSTFSQYTVLPEISVALIDNDLPLEKICLLGCGVTTGIGAVTKTAKMEKGATAAVFGLGAVGLSVIQGCVLAGASEIVAVDINPAKFDMAREFGATQFVNPNELPEGKNMVSYLQGTMDGGPDYSFACVGAPKVMRDAFECTHKGWGVSVVIGVAAAGEVVQTRPFNLVVGRVWKGSAFGGYKGRSELNGLCREYMDGKVKVDELITHHHSLAEINTAFELMHDGKSIRSVVALFDN